MSDTAYIYIDWGTTNCRIYTLNSKYELLEEFDHPSAGILTLQNKENYIEFYKNHILPLRKDESICVYLSGMVGSAPYGWELAPQLPVPINAKELSKHMYEIKDFKNIFIIPGIKETNAIETYDLIRGEEIQAFGIRDIISDKNTTICLPGTHSKWLFFKEDQISKFETMMTGETFNLFKDHSLLGTLINDENPKDLDKEYFQKGLKEAKDNDNLLNSLFKVRATFVGKEKIESNHVRSYLSGILIGYEVFKAVSTIEDVETSEVIIVSSKTLASPYHMALDHYGVKNRWVSAKEASINGLKHILKGLEN